MIEVAQSRSGHPILKFDGRLLASSIEPISEAERWIVQARVTIAVEKSQCPIIVLGFGCGYHVAKLAEAFPKRAIFVIEYDAEIAAQTLKTNEQLKKINLFIGSDWQGLLAHESLRVALAGPFIVLKHLSSLQVNPGFYQLVQSLFLSRDMTSFLLQLRYRPDLYAELNEDALKKMVTSNELVSIKTLKSLFRGQTYFTHERKVWKVLEELVV